MYSLWSLWTVFVVMDFHVSPAPSLDSQRHSQVTWSPEHRGLLSSIPGMGNITFHITRHGIYSDKLTKATTGISNLDRICVWAVSTLFHPCSSLRVRKIPSFHQVTVSCFFEERKDKEHAEFSWNKPLMQGQTEKECNMDFPLDLQDSV